MTKRKCKDCGNQVSKRAKKCPACGAPVKTKKGCLGVVGLLFLIAIAIGAISSALDRGASAPQTPLAAVPQTAQKPTPRPTRTDEPKATPQSKPKAEPEKPVPAKPVMPDWKDRQAELKAQYLSEFKAPSVGSQVSLTLKGGGTQKGTIKSLTDSQVEIERGGTTLAFSQSQLSTASRVRCFASDYATYRAYKQTKKEKDAFVVRERARTAELEAKRKVEEEAALIPQKSYEAGFADGYLVGKTDAWEGRARDGMKAMRLGKIHGDSHSGDKAEYASGYHQGYNEGWHAAKKAGAPVK